MSTVVICDGCGNKIPASGYMSGKAELIIREYDFAKSPHPNPILKMDLCMNCRKRITRYLTETIFS